MKSRFAKVLGNSSSVFASFASAMRQRWMRGAVLVVVSAVIAAVVLFSVVIHGYYYSAVRTGLEAKARTATDFFANYVERSYADYYSSAYRYTESFNEADRIELQFINTDGSIMVSSSTVTTGASPDTPDVSAAIDSKRISSWVGSRTSTGERIMAASAPMVYSGGEVIGVMRYVSSLKIVDKQVFLNITAAAGVGLLVLVVFFSVNLIFISSVIKPVGEITKISKRIAEGSYGVLITNSYQYEIGDMVGAINEMSLKIAQTNKIQTEFISSISHELRTPLTAITGWGETLISNEQLDEDSRRGIAIMLREARRLTKMVEDLLEYTKIEDGRFTLSVTMINIAEELEDAIFTFRELLHQDELEFSYICELDEDTLIPGDSNRLKQVFLNLFDNAVKYGREGRRIEVSVGMSDGGYVRVSIRDYGPGVPADELSNIRMKFYKGSNSKERGSGIGLAVCDEIIKLHGGIMTLENAEGGGFIASVYLPAGGVTA